MEKLVKIDTKIIDKYKPDKFSLQQVFVNTGVEREYFVDGEWTLGSPKQKPDATRVVFDDIDKFRVGRDTYFAWQDLLERKKFGTERPEEVIKRLFESRLSRNSLTLFVPWGVRSQGEPKYEEVVLDMIKSFQDSMIRRKINAKVLLMPADLYATQVNRIDEELTTHYFMYVKNQAVERGFDVKPWSVIRTENIDIYKKRARELAPKFIVELVGNGKVLEAFDTARRRSGYSRQKDVEGAAFSYLRERICEAEIVESVYKPIKVSAVSKNKDNIVDRDLPRVYIIPQEYQFPWLK